MEWNAAIPAVQPLSRSSSDSTRADADKTERIYVTIRKATAGDRDALAELYVTYAGAVFACAYRILQDSHEAEDVTQQVFLKLMSALQHYERRAVPFTGWLMRVARNAALDAERRRRPVRLEEDVRAPNQYEGTSPELGRSLHDALAALPSTQRRVVILRHVVGFSASEIADRLGTTRGSVHALDQRGRRTLQRDLRKVGSAPATNRHPKPVPISSAA